MGTPILISSTNYNGQIGDITFFPATGGTISLGSFALPTTLNLDYYLGDYEVYFSAYNSTCLFEIDVPPTPSVSPTNTPTITPTLTPFFTPTITPTNTITPSITPTKTVTPSITPTITSTVTPTIAFYSSLFYTGSTACGACAQTGSVMGYWALSAGTTLNIGEYLYLDNSLTIPAPNNFYVPDYDHNDWLQTINGTGIIGSKDPNGCPSCVTPTPSVTPTKTPAITPSVTPSLTPTKTPTLTPSITPSPTPNDYCCYLGIGNGSLDISITDVKVSGVSVTYLSGTTFPIDPADPLGEFYTYQTGSSVTVEVFFTSSISGQNISLQDCAETVQCQDTTGSGGSFVFTNVDLSCGCSWTINAADGACV